MFETQRYPEVKLVAGREIVRPYDVSAWTLPLMMGVSAERATLPEGLARYQPIVQTVPAPTGNAFAVVPGSPENTKVVNAALRAKGAAVSIARAPVSHAAGAGGGTVFLDLAGRARPPGWPDSPLSGRQCVGPSAVEKLRAPA